LRLHIHKKAFRALGISESFVRGSSGKSILAGVVLRSDWIIDGFTFSKATLGGMDATEKVIGMYKALGRNDINVLMLNGCVISWYNVIDLQRVYEETAKPLICVTYEESEGLDKYFLELFPEDCGKRLEIYHKNGPRTPVKLHTGHEVYVRFYGMKLEEAKGILNKLTLHGAIPEPLRVARLLARGIMKMLYAN